MRWVRAALLSVPLLELVVAIIVGRAIGAGWTILALLALSVVGGMTIKRAGLRSLGQLDASVAAGRSPSSDVADTGMLFLAGLLLIFPGFVTGALGLLLLPPLRTLARRPLERRLRTAAANRVTFFSQFGPGFGSFGSFGSFGGPAGGPLGGPGSSAGPGGETFAGNSTVYGRSTDGVVITGEVVDDPEAPRHPREPGDPTP